MINTDKLASEYEQMNDSSFIQVESDQPDYWRETELHDNMSIAESDSVSTVSQTSEGRKTKIKTKFSELHAHDKGFFKLKTGRNKPSITGFSTSYHPGSTIRNASTGYFESDYMGKPIYRVGNIDEDLFFRVSLSVNGTGSETRKLFYDNPEQYERHFRATISNEIKEKWRAQYDFALKRDELRRHVEEERQYTTIN
jgi:hypothetical protein